MSTGNQKVITPQPIVWHDIRDAGGKLYAKYSPDLGLIEFQDRGKRVTFDLTRLGHSMANSTESPERPERQCS